MIAISASLTGALPASTVAQEAAPPYETNDVKDHEALSVARLIEVWSFIKYHHSDATSGKLAMDLHFFELYSKIRAAGAPEDTDRILAAWLGELGSGAPCDPCAQASDPETLALASPTPQWLETLPSSLAAPLTQIYAKRTVQQAQFSVHPDRSTRKAVFSNEADYSRVWRIGDEALWALTLARTWSALQFWFPYRDVMDESPTVLLRRAAAEIITADTPDAYKNAVSRFVAGSDDGHANIPQFYSAFFPTEAGCTIPYSLRYIEGRLVVDGRSMQDGGPLQAGDALVAIDGEDAEANADLARPFVAASNDYDLGRSLMAAARLGPCREREVAIERAGQPMAVEVEWQDYRSHSINSFAPHYQPGETIEQLPGGITYVRYEQLQIADLERLSAEANSGIGMIIDMRGYASDNIISQFVGMLVDHPIAMSRSSLPSVATPGEFFWKDPAMLVPREDAQRINVPVIALIDHSAKSASEYVAMALRAAGVPIIGSRSAGADGNYTTMPLPTGGGMNFSGIGIYYPDKSPTQRIGIVPDIVVKPTIAGIAAGRDEVLELALTQLRSMQDDAER